jgi:hypothetical protein
MYNAESMITFLQMTTTVLADAKIKSTKVKKRTRYYECPVFEITKIISTKFISSALFLAIDKRKNNG